MTARVSLDADATTLIEKIVRLRIRDSRYWKEHCFGLTAEKLVDKAVELRCFGGTVSEMDRPTPFICLILKMLHLKPSLDIVLALIHNEEFKYVRLLGAFYLRLVGTGEDIYTHLEPLLADYRKLAKRTRTTWELTTMDEVIEELLTQPFCCEIALPRLAARRALIAAHKLPDRPRESSLREQFEALTVTRKRPRLD